MRGSDMPGHGDHWEALYPLEVYRAEKLERDCREAVPLCKAPCRDVAHGTERTEQVICLRYGNDRIAHQVLIVSDSTKRGHFLFSAYPVLLDGIVHTVTVERIEPWEYGIEGWVHVSVTAENIPLAFFDTMFFNGSGELESGERIEVSLAGLAYRLHPIRMRTFEVKEGPVWEMERARQLAEGASVEEANAPLVVHMTGAAILLPRGGDTPDDAQFQGVIETLDTIEHDGQKIYRLEMVVLRPGGEEFRLPVYASEHALDGYIPRLGEDVEGILWVQGRTLTDRAPPAWDNEREASMPD
jgi:hypothetical protein